MKTIDFSYFIERYNSGEMDEAERLWFNKEMEGNRDLRNEVAIRKKTDMVLKDQDLIRLRQKLAEIEKQRAAHVHSRTHGRNSAWKYAAVILVFILAGTAILLKQGKISEEDIIAKFYEPYEGAAIARSQQSVVNQDYLTAIDFYNIHDYKNAAIYFGKVVSTDPKYIESTMYYGVSKYEEKNYPEAVQKFKIVTDDGDNLYIEDAQWYLALCYLQTSEKEMAVNLLKRIKESGSIYRNKASKILRKLK